MSQVIAFDIGGTHSRIALFDDGKLIWRDQTPTLGQQGPHAMLASMLALYQPMKVVQAPIGVAIAAQVVGPYVNASNESILSAWHHFPLAMRRFL